MPQLTYYVLGQRSPSSLEQAESTVRPRAIFGSARGPSRRLIERVELGLWPLPPALAREWVADPAGLEQAARIARELSDGPVAVRALAAPKRNVGRFVCGAHFVKIGLREQVRSVGRENICARWAGEQGLAPRVTQTPGWQGTLVSEYIAAPAPTAKELRDPALHAQLARTLRSLHDKVPLFRRDDLLDPSALEHFVRLRRNKLQTRRAPLCDLLQLKARIEHLLPKLKLRRAEEVFCHFRVAPKHVRICADSLLLLGWSRARFADPLRDLAQFFALIDFDATTTHALLCQYFCGPPTLRASARFGVWLMTLALEEHCRLVASSRSDHAAVARSAQRIQGLESLVPALPPIDWHVPPTGISRWVKFGCAAG